MRKFAVLLLIVLAGDRQQGVLTRPLQTAEPWAATAEQEVQIELTWVADLDSAGPGKENSGIVKSRQWDDVFRIVNDSGDEPRVYAVTRQGEDYIKSRSDDTLGVLVGGAMNVDWEDIAVDASGNLIVGDFGNNYNDRRDLVLYHIREPAPKASRSSVFRKTFFYYPEQKSFPPSEADFNYDCEAIFTVGDIVYLLTKHRSDTRTRLYEVNTTARQPIAAKLLGSFDALGKVTAADCSPDGKRLIVTAYKHLRLFERRRPQDGFFQSSVRRVRCQSKILSSTAQSTDKPQQHVIAARACSSSVPIRITSRLFEQNNDSGNGPAAKNL